MSLFIRGRTGAPRRLTPFPIPGEEEQGGQPTPRSWGGPHARAPHRRQTDPLPCRGAGVHHRRRPRLRPDPSPLHPGDGPRRHPTAPSADSGRAAALGARPDRSGPRPPRPPGPERPHRWPGRAGAHRPRGASGARPPGRRDPPPGEGKEGRAVIAMTSSGRRFLGLARYLLHGRSGEETERVAWTAGRHLGTDDPELAPPPLPVTADQNGRVEAPVYHLTISFDPSDTVTRERM